MSKPTYPPIIHYSSSIIYLLAFLAFIDFHYRSSI
nr:MAG TPA: hypothetical protein [Ackermannviridae sp.]